MTSSRASKVHHTVQPSKWEQMRAKERITYESKQAGPIQLDWRTRSNYQGAELDYRGKPKAVQEQYP